jgi:hypothetical protein
MTKVDIKRLDSVTKNDTTATERINDNFKALQEAIENTLSRDGTGPNYMDADLDMNSYRIINSSDPVEETDIVNLKYVEERIGGAVEASKTAVASATQAANSAQSALVSSTNAINTLRNAEEQLNNVIKYVDDSIQTIDNTIAEAVEDVKQQALDAAQESIDTAAAQATAIVVDHAENVIKPQLNEIASNAEADAANAAESAELAANESDEAKHWAEDSRVWATGEDAEVEEIAPGEEEHSSRGYADLAMAIANAPEDVPVNASKLLALQIIKGPKGEKGDKGDKGDKGEKGDKGVAGGISVQEFEDALETKQDKGDYALIENIPTLVSQLDNDSGYTTQVDVMQAIASIPQFKLQIVDSLSRDDAAPMVLYLVSKGGSAPDVYDEYIWLEETGNYEFLGTTAVDLTGYVKNTDYPTTAKAGVIKAYTQNGFGVNYLGQPFSQTINLASYKSYGGNYFIGKGTLENIKYDLVRDGIVNNNFSLGEADRQKVRNWIGASAEAIQKDSFSTWPADRNIDKIYQYIGETTEEYVNGYFYRSVEGESTYVTADPRNLTFDYDLFWSELENAGITLETLRLTEEVKAKGGFSIMGLSESETEYRVSNINGIAIDVLLTKSVQSSENIVGTSTRWYYTYTTIYEWKPIEVQPSAKTVLTTQADYDALATKDANTLYLIEE